MLPLGDFADVQYLNFNHSTMFQENWNVMPSNMQTLGGNITGVTSCQMLPTLHEMNPQQSPSVSNNSSDEAEQRLYSIIDERKQRRMISNRESARRSRMRKQKHLDEMWSQVIRLRTEKHSFLEKFNQMLDSHNDVVQENAKLKDEVSHLWKMITNLQSTSPKTFLRDLEETPCSVDNAKEALSNNSSSSSVDLLK